MTSNTTSWENTEHWITFVVSILFKRTLKKNPKKQKFKKKYKKQKNRKNIQKKKKKY